MIVLHFLMKRGLIIYGICVAIERVVYFLRFPVAATATPQTLVIWLPNDRFPRTNNIIIILLPPTSSRFSATPRFRPATLHYTTHPRLPPSRMFLISAFKSPSFGPPTTVHPIPSHPIRPVTFTPASPSARREFFDVAHLPISTTAPPDTFQKNNHIVHNFTSVGNHSASLLFPPPRSPLPQLVDCPMVLHFPLRFDLLF